jgi:hypothetical protein
VHIGFWWNVKERSHLEDLDIHARITLKWIIRRFYGEWGGTWTGLIWLRIGTDGGLFEGGNRCSGSVKCGEFLD